MTDDDWWRIGEGGSGEMQGKYFSLHFSFLFSLQCQYFPANIQISPFIYFLSIATISRISHEVNHVSDGPWASLV